MYRISGHRDYTDYVNEKAVSKNASTMTSGHTVGIKRNAREAHFLSCLKSLHIVTRGKL